MTIEPEPCRVPSTFAERGIAPPLVLYPVPAEHIDDVTVVTTINVKASSWELMMREDGVSQLVQPAVALIMGCLCSSKVSNGALC